MTTKNQIKKPTLLWVIIGFVVTILLVVTDLESIEDLWYLYVMFLLYDFIALVQYFNRKKAYEKMLKDAEGLLEDGTPISNVQLSVPATIKVIRKSSIIGAIVSYKIYLNNEFVGKVKNGKTLELSTSVSHNIIMVFDKQDNPFQGEFVADLEDGGYAEVYVMAGRFVKK